MDALTDDGVFVASFNIGHFDRDIAVEDVKSLLKGVFYSVVDYQQQINRYVGGYAP